MERARVQPKSSTNNDGVKSSKGTGTGAELKLLGHIGRLYCHICKSLSADPRSIICLSLDKYKRIQLCIVNIIFTFIFLYIDLYNNNLFLVNLKLTHM